MRDEPKDGCEGDYVFSGTASSWIFSISASLMVAKRQFKPAILFCLDHTVNNDQLLRDSELIRLLETPRSLSEYILINDSRLLASRILD